MAGGAAADLSGLFVFDFAAHYHFELRHAGDHVALEAFDHGRVAGEAARVKRAHFGEKLGDVARHFRIHAAEFLAKL